MEGGYWDDREETHPDYDDGDWVQPNHLALIFWANYAFEVKVQPCFPSLWWRGNRLPYRVHRGLERRRPGFAMGCL